ncbi:MAG: hypothetical protein JXR31_16730 [Prolixibacteraceae bacterium]|nr:hypothetical protein [Prolixibacteraceae bacterium]MBN2775904.1 hypothetical protein [Prolixibacteraceae bacterium]
MKIRISSLLVIVLIVSWNCSNKDRSLEIASYTYVEEQIKLNPELKERLGDWVKEDVICYGLVVQVDANGIAQFGKPVKAKVIRFQEDGVKMKAMEKVSVAEVEGCSKMGLAKGETWIEKDGDLFKTREEAVNYLKENKLDKR